MSNPQGPEQPDEVTDEVTEAGDDEAADGGRAGHRSDGVFGARARTGDRGDVSRGAVERRRPKNPERRFTAPSGFDAGATTEDRHPAGTGDRGDGYSHRAPPAAKTVSPQVIPPRGDAPKPPATKRRSWGWVIALVLVIAALVAVAVLGTLLLTRDSEPSVSQEDRVRTTIENYDAAIAKGDLATLRTITCGTPGTTTSTTTTACGPNPFTGRCRQAISRDRQHRPGGRQRRPCRGQRHDLHGLCAANPVDAEPGPGVPRRSVEDLPGAHQLALG